MTTVTKENIGNAVVITSIGVMLVGVGFGLSSVMNVGNYDEDYDEIPQMAKSNKAKTKAKISFGLAGIAGLVLFAKLSL